MLKCEGPIEKRRCCITMLLIKLPNIMVAYVPNISR
jgi:hypothetical protein